MTERTTPLAQLLREAIEHYEAQRKGLYSDAEVDGVVTDPDDAAHLAMLDDWLRRAREHAEPHDSRDACASEAQPLCSDCPPLGYPTDKTRCEACPRKTMPISEAGHACIDELMARDRAIYGTSYERIDADGTRARIDPSTVMIDVQPIDEVSEVRPVSK